MSDGLNTTARCPAATPTQPVAKIFTVGIGHGYVYQWSRTCCMSCTRAGRRGRSTVIRISSWFGNSLRKSEKSVNQSSATFAAFCGCGPSAGGLRPACEASNQNTARHWRFVFRRSCCLELHGACYLYSRRQQLSNTLTSARSDFSCLLLRRTSALLAFSCDAASER